MPSLRYLNFDLLFTKSGDQFRVHVINAPGGDASALFELPFTEDDIPRLIEAATAGHDLGMSVTPGKDSASDYLREMGSRLFQSIFRDQVRTVFDASLPRAEEAGRALRIRLRFSEEVIALARFPWEILFDPQQNQFLALSESHVIVRYLSLPRPRPALVVEPPLSILVVMASPHGYVRLDIEREWRSIDQALAPLIEEGKVALERLEPPTINMLQTRLLREPVHVIHCVGHGMYDADRGEGFLLFADDEGGGHEVPAEALGLLLHNHTSLRLAYLNACEGAIGDGHNAFTGVAQALVQKGVPAAVAMQGEITDEAAIEMARRFYTALAAGRPADAALTHARVSLAAAGTGEWLIPVHFSRSPDNRLFDVVDMLPASDCPYPGMQPFDEEQATLFYGRDNEIKEAVARLHQYPFLAVVGPSGSGKSSLANAGIIPMLRRDSRFSQNQLKVCVMRPGDATGRDGRADPMQALAATLGRPVDDPVAVLFDSPTLLFIDQFEESFAIVDAEKQERFLQTLHTLIARPNLYMLLAVRADFYPDLMSSGTLWSRIQANRLELAPLGDDQLWRAIVEPAAQMGVSVTDALAVALIADASGSKDTPLPLVQQTLVLLWPEVERRTLALDAYRRMADGERNGLQVAIDRWADNVYDNQLPSEAKPIARRIFLRLIQFGQGHVDTRRQQQVSNLQAAGDDLALFTATLDRLADNRLITLSSTSTGKARTVDLAHETIIKGWTKLGIWIAECKEVELTRRRLELKADEWTRFGSSDTGLLGPEELEEAVVWKTENRVLGLGESKVINRLIEASQTEIKAVESAKRLRRTVLLTLLALVLLAPIFAALNHVGKIWINRHWQPTAIDMPNGGIRSMASHGNLVVIGSYNYGMAFSDVDDNWTGWLSRGLPAGDDLGAEEGGATVQKVVAIAIDAADKQTVYAHAGNYGMYRAVDDGWVRIGENQIPPGTTAVQPVDVFGRTILYATGEPGIFLSDDGGETWRNLAEDDASMARPYDAVAFGESGHAYLAARSGLTVGKRESPLAWHFVAYPWLDSDPASSELEPKLDSVDAFRVGESDRIYVGYTDAGKPWLACLDADGGLIGDVRRLPTANRLADLGLKNFATSIVGDPYDPTRFYVATSHGAVYDMGCDGDSRRVGQRFLVQTSLSALAIHARDDGRSDLYWANAGHFEHRLLDGRLDE